jgi:hypothetical protein
MSVFSPTDMTEDEARTNAGFAAIREVDTRRPRRSEIARMMSEKPRIKTA